MGGVVNGSVNITKAKNNNGVLTSNLQKLLMESDIPIKCEPSITIVATTKKLITRSDRSIFLVSKNPPIKTKGAIDMVPAHQLADWLSAKAVKATANAAGLKTCFFLIAKIYFDAIAHTEAHNARLKNCMSCGETIGVMIKTRMRAVIYTDSVFVGASNARAKIIFVIRQMVVIKNVEKRRAMGL